MTERDDSFADPLGLNDALDEGDYTVEGEPGARPDHGDELPSHEFREGDAVGGGIMGAGGTAVDRGTGTLSGQAQGPDETIEGEADARDDDAGPTS